jgi:hypothetical protein
MIGFTSSDTGVKQTTEFRNKTLNPDPFLHSHRLSHLKIDDFSHPSPRSIIRPIERNALENHATYPNGIDSGFDSNPYTTLSLEDPLMSRNDLNLSLAIALPSPGPGSVAGLCEGKI